MIMLQQNIEAYVKKFWDLGIDQLPNIAQMELVTKKTVYLKIYTEILALVDRLIENEISGKKLKCRKGCSYCCNDIILVHPGHLQVILNYLANNGDAKRNFLLKYSTWDNDFEPYREQFWDSIVNFKVKYNVYKKITSNFKSACPFLMDGCCSIYDVRPIVCRTWFAKRSLLSCKFGWKSKKLNLDCEELINEKYFDINRYFAVNFMQRDEPRGSFVMVLPHGVYFPQKWNVF